METVVLIECNSALLHKFRFNWIVLGSLLPFSFEVNALPLATINFGGNVGYAGDEIRADADESLSQLKAENILWTFNTAFRLQSICVTGSQIKRKPK